VYKLLKPCNIYLVLCFLLLQLLTIISTIDDLNYPEKTNTYYIVNVPYIFTACWKVSLDVVDRYNLIFWFAINQCFPLMHWFNLSACLYVKLI